MRKTILFFCKVNEIIEEIYNALKDDYNLQIMDEFEDMDRAERMLNLVKPDLIFISLVGVFEPLTALYTTIKRDYTSIPVITMGTAREYTKQSKFCQTPQIEFVERPVEVKVIVDMCSDKAYMSERDKRAARRRILIVDDDPVMLRTTKSLLDDLYEVSIAPSGEKCLMMLDRKHFDLILMDYEMPEMDGRATLEKIRKSSEYSNIPVIFLTGIKDRAHIQAIIGLKPAAYMLKPPVKDKLVAEISRIFAG